MRIAVISDLHLGSDDPTDTFGHDDAEFLRFLSFLESNFEQIVLLGDIWETLTPRCPWSATRALADAKERHREIAQRFQRPQYRYIHGNHDLIARDVDQAPESWLLETHGRRLLFTHGHAYDRLLSYCHKLVELGVCLGGWLRRAGFHRFYDWLESLETTRSAVSEDPSRCTFQAWAADTAKLANADVVVTGHTHLALAKERDDHIFLNSGSCSMGRFTYLGMEVSSDTYGVHHTW